MPTPSSGKEVRAWRLIESLKETIYKLRLILDVENKCHHKVTNLELSIIILHSRLNSIACSCFEPQFNIKYTCGMLSLTQGYIRMSCRMCVWVRCIRPHSLQTNTTFWNINQSRSLRCCCCCLCLCLCREVWITRRWQMIQWLGGGGEKRRCAERGMWWRVRKRMRRESSRRREMVSGEWVCQCLCVCYSRFLFCSMSCR